MYQPKVNQTEQYSDSQGTHTVCRGKLILPHNKKVGYTGRRIGNKLTGNSWVPIIISETEEILFNDWVYMDVLDNSTNMFQVIEDKSDLDNYNKTKGCYKILTLPEQFSNKHLQAIIDGKIEEGEVLVKCDSIQGYKVHLNQQNHITLFPAKQSLEESIEIDFNYRIKNQLYYPSISDKEDHRRTFLAGVEWAKKNNY